MTLTTVGVLAQPAPGTSGVAELTAPRPSPPAGLTAAEAAARLREVGPNEPKLQRLPVWKTLGPLLADPLAIVLFIASLVAASVGEITDAVLIQTMLLLSIAMNFGQTYRSQRAADRLRREVGPTAAVLRDGVWSIVPRAEIVPGDVIRITAGDLVPADALLFESRELHIYEAALTGESMPAAKDADSSDPEQRGVSMGTSVASGTGDAVVVRTGADTSFGDIVARLSAARPETEFERGTRRFGVLVAQTIFALVMFVMLVSIVMRRDPLESLLFSLALAVGLAPEFLPMIRSVTLARGAVRMAKKDVIIKHLAAIQNFGSIDVLCSDKTGTITTGTMAVTEAVDAHGEPSRESLRLAAVNAALQTGIRSPFDDAIARAQPLTPLPKKIDEVPFDFERRIVSVVVEDRGRRLLVAKGAPESIVARCRFANEAGAAGALELAQRCGAKGARILAVATCEVPQASRYGRGDEHDMELAGFVAFEDPPLPNAAAAVKALHRDGVVIKILTGDSDVVTRAVCDQVGIASTPLLLGTELEQMTDVALARAAEGTAVFARLTPAQKTRIVLALKSHGHVVGFLGDGINDAPSLRAADVGISVANAVGIAKEAAEIILLDRGLDVLHRGIREGRRAFGNFMKYVLMETSSNFGNMFSMAAASIVLPFLPMLPTQILLNNFLYDLSQITIPTDHVDASYMRKPQRWDVGTIRRFMLLVGPVSSLFDFATFWILLKLFASSARLFQTGWFVESLITQTLVLLVIRTAANPLKSRPSAPLLASVAAIVCVALALPYTRLGLHFGFVPLPLRYLAFLSGVTALYLVVVQAVKHHVLALAAERRA